MNQATPKSMRLHIGLFGRRNVGKSSLLNALTRQHVSVVSDVAGTTTDPVEKPMELASLGPVVFIDTAGLDDESALGELRVKRTMQVFDRTDLGVLVCQASQWGEYERRILLELSARQVPTIVVFNKCDLNPPHADASGEIDPAVLDELRRRQVRRVCTSARTGQGLAELRRALVECAPRDVPGGPDEPAIVGDLVGAGELAVLVVPIDKAAPKGRLILPQVQAIRDLLDAGAMCMVVGVEGLNSALARLDRPPKLVVTDSQAFAEVAAQVPADVALTSFSILFSRYKGDLVSQVRGTLSAERLRIGDRVLVAESCCHHPVEQDIGRVKIPRLLTRRVGGALRFDHVQGNDFPEDLSPYRLVIHCGACMTNRRQVLARLARCQEQGVAMTNYGLVIAWSLGILERALQPFPAALQAYRESLCTEAGAGRHIHVQLTTDN